MTNARTPRWNFLKMALPFVLGALPAIAQQTNVQRFDVFGGYNYLNSSSVGLSEPGFGFQIGFRPSTWYSVGFDYTNGAGDLTLKPDQLLTDLQERLGAQLAQLAAAGRLPAGYKLSVLTHSKTQTFAVGPQLAYRRFKQLTLFGRPLFAGLIREEATPKPGDAIAKGIVAQLAPSGKKRDTTPFFGFGGGVDVNFSPHFAVRVQADLVHDHLFDDLLRNGRWTTRFAVGPAFNFGGNIVK